MLRGINPRAVYSQLTGDSAPLPDTISDLMLWKVIADYFAEIPTRSRLTNISTLDDVVSLLKSCSKIIVLTGAGVSVSCGIPDFRSKDGVYARLAVDFPDLPDPHAMFDIGYFRRDPRPFFKFACEIYPGQFKPSPCHRFIKMLERQNKLLRNYTQNIDTLEKVAGIERVVECHGSFATATCTRCGHSVPSEVIRETVFKQQIPFCPKCSEASSPDEDKGVMKPDIVFFGEGLPESFHSAMGRDKDECDLLIVIGSSLKVQPVSLIPCSLPSHVPQVLINRERLHHLKFDVELLGDSDVIIDHICHM
ncbi:hypothetical protein AAG570_003860 [Ranatra chinensis]|uniref:protein acetyllysine N-acetyltransferase n=1 Tax=Ranatra chinensis TaxID=642074 RepID=A0ABD0YK89_9HEMI